MDAPENASTIPAEREVNPLNVHGPVKETLFCPSTAVNSWNRVPDAQAKPLAVHPVGAVLWAFVVEWSTMNAVSTSPVTAPEGSVSERDVVPVVAVVVEGDVDRQAIAT